MKIIIRIFCFISLIELTGCLSYKEMVNFQDGQDLGKNGKVLIPEMAALTLHPDDLVSITINSYNQEEALRFNVFSNQSQVQLSAQGSQTSTVADPLGYRVDSRGFIEMPVIGRFRVEGLTLEQLRDSVHSMVAATGYLKEHSVQVRYLSFRITILGEVNNPGTYTVASQRINILEALGMAKDLTLYSKRNNILVVREENGKRIYGRVDMKSKSMFESPYYYLRPNDVLYVEPHHSKILSAPDPVSRYLGIVLGLATLATLLSTL